MEGVTQGGGARMTNTFGSTSQSNQFPLVDPRCVREHRERFRRDCFTELELANSFYMTSGRWPDQGWILLDRRSLDQISQYATDLQLTICDYVNSPLTITDLSLVQARCVTKGQSSDPDAIYLVQVTSTQGVIYNPWFQTPVNAYYNIRAPGYSEKFFDWSMNGSNPWTWGQMLNNLWDRAPSQLGSYPGLPSLPQGTPEGWAFPGVSLWESICHILDHLGFAIAGSYPDLTIVEPGAADEDFEALVARYREPPSLQFCLEDDMEYSDGGAGRAPGQVVVYFHRRQDTYGTEETIRYDSFNWGASPAYTVTVSAPGTRWAGAPGTAFLWDDFTVRYDQNQNAIGADVAIANAIAIERVQAFYNKLFRGTEGFMRQVYSGVLPFTTGSLVDGVRWYNTGYLDANGRTKDYCGWRTEIIRGYAWEEVTFPLTLQGITGPA